MKTFYVTLVGKPRMTKADAWKGRPVVERYWSVVNELKKQALESGYKLPDAFYVQVYLPMPTSWSLKKKRAMFGKPHQEKPDVDNLLKTLLDALKDDDKTVHDVRVKKIWCDNGLIMIKPLSDNIVGFTASWFESPGFGRGFVIPWR